MAITAEILINSNVIFCAVFLLHMATGGKPASFQDSTIDYFQSPEIRSVIIGMIRIVDAISPIRRFPG